MASDYCTTQIIRASGGHNLDEKLTLYYVAYILLINGY